MYCCCPPCMPYKCAAAQLWRVHPVSCSAGSLPLLLCRQASGPAIRVGVKAALAEAVTRPTDERVHAAGALLAEAVTGVSHGLHSRAAAVLGPVLCEGVLRPEDFKSAKVSSWLWCLHMVACTEGAVSAAHWLLPRCCVVVASSLCQLRTTDGGSTSPGLPHQPSVLLPPPCLPCRARPAGS